MAAVVLLVLLWWLLAGDDAGRDASAAPCPPGTDPCVLGEGPPTCCTPDDWARAARELEILDRIRRGA